jgi:hypothetical protein
VNIKIKTHHANLHDLVPRDSVVIGGRWYRSSSQTGSDTDGSIWNDSSCSHVSSNVGLLHLSTTDGIHRHITTDSYVDIYKSSVNLTFNQLLYIACILSVMCTSSYELYFHCTCKTCSSNSIHACSITSSPAKSSPLLTFGEPLGKSSGFTCIKHSQNLIGRKQKR